MKNSRLPHIPVPEDLKNRFMRVCNKQGRSMSDVIRQLIIQHTESEEAKR